MNRLLSVLVMCMSMGASANSPTRPAAQESAAQGTAAPEAGGLTWTAPSEWAAQGARPMRAATYKLPAAKGDTEGGELAVFYFGPGQGGAVDANVKRWLGQFQTADGKPVDGVAKTKSEKLNGMPVTTVDVKGTYMGGGPMMGPSTPKPGYRLLGAIVEGSEGAIFFKLTGPEKTVAASEKAFRKMLESVKKK
ncbi:hypothetical protein MYSTI_07636 [Myxococcus stipitatus DSM 14675]|uniref:Lipoprotein n=1 Tax=Myxococcus stipitatus (strain DSM 14675 / JCM 12634 / Mx s8) TaxID=1278073 RepID=L7ULM8_MYXSD|nr:hypothetical protein [Myxococcus stipitatus]AGC48908.1 hypothetical protein MYSTI_07636 [Myxococcus stipitatus DSM 14675]